MSSRSRLCCFCCCSCVFTKHIGFWSSRYGIIAVSFTLWSSVITLIAIISSAITHSTASMMTMTTLVVQCQVSFSTLWSSRRHFGPSIAVILWTSIAVPASITASLSTSVSTSIAISTTAFSIIPMSTTATATAVMIVPVIPSFVSMTAAATVMVITFIVLAAWSTIVFVSASFLRIRYSSSIGFPFYRSAISRSCIVSIIHNLTGKSI
ncbi:hypothetical protein BDF20DRAFT_866287, partial [Mycotypha africana]|uniref:uncharacterized protein n=1 Tax=Mycotypha africana TaxID=64632 RepID=UPI0023005673